MNANHEANAGDRRDFLRRVAVGGLTAITATLLVRNAKGDCISGGICRGCAAYDDCGLPRALSAKQVLGDKRLKGAL